MYRKTDPQSSKAAAERITRTGKVYLHKTQILMTMKTLNRPATSKEIAQAAQSLGFNEIDRYEAARRLPEMVRAGLICVQTFHDGRENQYSFCGQMQCEQTLCSSAN